MNSASEVGMAAEQGSHVAAGPITFMVEHRSVVQDGVEAGGPTVRVLGSRDQHEYLRFDMFNVNAHYHYEPPAEKERILMIDTVADGDPVDWAIERLRGRLAPMLAAAGAESLAGELDGATLARAVDEVETLVRRP